MRVLVERELAALMPELDATGVGAGGAARVDLAEVRPVERDDVAASHHHRDRGEDLAMDVRRVAVAPRGGGEDRVDDPRGGIRELLARRGVQRRAGVVE